MFRLKPTPKTTLLAGRRRAEAERLERHPDLGGPPPREVLAARLPDRIPVEVPGSRVLPVLAHVEDDSVRVRGEEDRAALIVVGVEQDRHRVVAADVLVAEHRPGTGVPGFPVGVGNLVTLDVVFADRAEEPEVEVLVVVEHPDDRPLGRGQALVGLALVEVADRDRPLPGVLVEPAVHLDPLPGPLGVDLPGPVPKRPDPLLAGHPAQFRSARRGGPGRREGGRPAPRRSRPALPGPVGRIRLAPGAGDAPGPEQRHRARDRDRQGPLHDPES